MLVYDDGIDVWVNEYRKWYECPRCNTPWTDEDVPDDMFQKGYKDQDFINTKVLNIDDGKEIPYRQYIEKKCPHCSDIIIDGRLKGPGTKVDLEGKELLYREMKCQICGSADIEYRETTDMPNGAAICNNCNTYHFIRNGNDKVTHLFYREDLQTRQFNENFSECVDILESKGTPIKSGGKMEGR